MQNNKRKIKFKKDYNWEDYVKENVLEITCDEAPYLVSSHDTLNANILDFRDRIGVLDRKLRVVNKKVVKKDKDKWISWAIESYKHTYGYECKGILFLYQEKIYFIHIKIIMIIDLMKK